MANLKTNLGNVSIPSYVFNAAGPKDETYEELQVIGRSKSSCITMKSCTIQPREGNPQPRYAFTQSPYGSISTSGLPNLGYQEYIRIASLIKKEFPDKPILASVAGLKPGEFSTLIKAFQESKVDLIEVNLHSYPKEKGELPLALNPITLEELFKEITTLGNKPLGLKLPPIFDLELIESLANLFKEYKICYLATLSSLAPALVIDADTEKAVIKPKNGIGGLGGAYVKPLALANVNLFYKQLKGEVSIVGVGGVQTGLDAFEFLLAGADAVQVGTTFYEEGPECFQRISDELNSILDKKGYKNIDVAKGKLP